MLSIPKRVIVVKGIQAGEFSPGGEDRATLESDLSAPSGPSGESSPVSFWNTPDGLKAINSPANDVYSPKPPSNTTVDVSPGSFPASVDLTDLRYVNCDLNPEPEMGILDAYREHCYKLEHSPCTFLHLKHKQDGSTALYRVNACSTSRYFQEGRAYIIENLRQRLNATQGRGVFFHLTVHAKRCTLSEAWRSMWPCYKRFKDALNVYRKGHMNAKHGIGYLAVLEPHQSDYPHLHVYCPGLRWLIKEADLPKMDQWWRMGSVKTEKELRRDSARGYILKYISKLDGWSEVSLALIWRYKIRIYNLSRKYRTGTVSESQWDLLARYSDAKELAKGLDMTINEAQKVLDAIADMDENLIHLS